jgi:3-hydroxyisobutyrate dehydrogenase
VTLALQMARDFGVPMRIGEIALGELVACIERGWGERDCRVAMTLQEERAGVSVRMPAEKLQGILD